MEPIQLGAWTFYMTPEVQGAVVLYRVTCEQADCAYLAKDEGEAHAFMHGFTVGAAHA